MKTKTCSDCNATKPVTEFPSTGYNTLKDGSRNKVYKPQCKPCLVNKQRAHFNELWHKYFEAKCSVCGYDKCRAALELHHVDEEDKSFTFSSRHSISEETFAREAKKCVVVCANCHREIHNGS